MKKLILLSGIPASGKSTYGRWLEKEKGVIYWDLENETLEIVNSRSGFYLGTGHNLNSLCDAAISINKTIVIDWGFPPDACINTVKFLIEKGVIPWWFDGDRNAAGISFLNRNTVPGVNLDTQMLKIEKHWPQIQDLFGENIIRSIEAGPKYTSQEDIYYVMFD